MCWLAPARVEKPRSHHAAEKKTPNPTKSPVTIYRN